MIFIDIFYIKVRHAYTGDIISLIDFFIIIIQEGVTIFSLFHFSDLYDIDIILFIRTF
jgi:hypothetical protein